MLRRSVFTLFILITFIAAGAVAATAQTGAVGGTVTVEKADGTIEPVAGAKVDCYRTDSNLGCRSATTNSRGEFTILGIPFNATVALAVSGDGIAPIIFPEAKPQQVDIEIRVKPGDGSVINEAEARAIVEQYKMNPTGELTEEQKKAKEEEEKRIAAIKAKNEKAMANNQEWEKLLKEGNEAFNSGDYDTAIAKFQQGIDVDPEFIGAAPAFYNNKGAALKKRATLVYNAGVKSKDNAQLAEARNKAQQDLSESLKSYGKTYEIINGAEPGTVPDAQNAKTNMNVAADGGRDAIRIMVLIQAIDPELSETATNLTNEYVNVETDKKKKGEALANLGSYLFSSGDLEGAVKAYKQAYEYSPKDPEVLGKLSLALYSIWESDPTDAGQKEAIKYLDEYLAVAPKDHIYRDDLGCLANGMLKKKKYQCSQDQ